MTRIRNTIAALAADLLGVALVFWLLPPLSTRFQDLGFFNSVLMGLFFTLFCLSVVGLKKLWPRSTQNDILPPFVLRKQPLAVLGVLFALSITTAIAYVVGFLDSVVAINRGLLDEPSVTIYLLLTPASWFGLALIYMLVLSNEGEPTIEPSTARYGLVAFLSLAGVNLMGVVFTAVWHALWARFGGAQAGTIVLLLLFVLYLLLLGPPRLLYLSRTRHLLSLLTFLPLILYLALLSMP